MKNGRVLEIYTFFWVDNFQIWKQGIKFKRGEIFLQGRGGVGENVIRIQRMNRGEARKEKQRGFSKEEKSYG